MPQDGKRNNTVPKSLNNGRYEVERKLGAGCFGEVYKGINPETKEQVAVKMEEIHGHAPQLEHEADVLRALAKPTLPQGFAAIFYFGLEGRYHVMVIELLGKSLEDRMQGCNGKLHVHTVTLIAEQVLQRIEYLHSKCIIHRDIKPENFMFGVKEKQHHLYLIDFGLSKRYYDVKHVQIRAKLSLTGTARYASINAHKGVEQSRRDDLEAIGHMLTYFLRGSLPWSGLDAKTQEEKYRKIREKKEEVKLEDLCEGYPDAFKNYLSISRNLEFKERPDYKKLKKLFSDIRPAGLEDHGFEWFQKSSKGEDQKNKLEGLVPLEKYESLLQPDDQVPKTGLSQCFCFSSKNVRD